LNALVSRIVCAVGFFEPVWALPEALLFPFVFLPGAVAFVLPLAVFPGAAVFPGVAVLPFGAGFFGVVVAAGGGVAACPVTPPKATGPAIAVNQATTTADRTLPPTVAIIFLSFQPTSPL